MSIIKQFFICRKTLFALWLLCGIGLISDVQAQKPRTQIALDTLSVLFEQVQLNADSSALKRSPLPAKQYQDSITHYNYYALTDTLAIGNYVQMRIEKTPKSGYLYLFSVDARQNIKLLWNGSIDSLHRQYPKTVLLPDTTKGYVFEFVGTEYFCLWYSTQPILKYEQLAYGLEFTNGTFMERIKMQLNNKMPDINDRTVKLMPQKIAATMPTFKPADSTKNNNNRVIPLIIAAAVKKESTPKNKREVQTSKAEPNAKTKNAGKKREKKTREKKNKPAVLPKKSQ